MLGTGGRFGPVQTFGPQYDDYGEGDYDEEDLEGYEVFQQTQQRAGAKNLTPEQEKVILRDLSLSAQRNTEFIKVLNILANDPELRPLIFEHESLLKALKDMTELKAEQMLSILTAAETEMFESSQKQEVGTEKSATLKSGEWKQTQDENQSLKDRVSVLEKEKTELNQKLEKAALKQDIGCTKCTGYKNLLNEARNEVQQAIKAKDALESQLTQEVKTSTERTEGLRMELKRLEIERNELRQKDSQDKQLREENAE
jgi:hypothetical protein